MADTTTAPSTKAQVQGPTPILPEDQHPWALTSGTHGAIHSRHRQIHPGVAFDVEHHPRFTVTVSGTFVATLKAQGSNNMETWEDLLIAEISKAGTMEFDLSNTGYLYFALPIVTYTSGEVTAIFDALP